MLCASPFLKFFFPWHGGGQICKKGRESSKSIVFLRNILLPAPPPKQSCNWRSRWCKCCPGEMCCSTTYIVEPTPDQVIGLGDDQGLTWCNFGWIAPHLPTFLPASVSCFLASRRERIGHCCQNKTWIVPPSNGLQVSVENLWSWSSTKPFSIFNFFNNQTTFIK